MKTSPILSVIVPVYNGEKYIVRCLDSLVAQDFPDVEVICIDDGSSDASLSILRSYAERDSRIRVIAQENRGVSAARNVGLDAARGEWIGFVDSDDELVPGAWETLLSSAGDEDLICFSAEEILLRDGRKEEVKSGYFHLPFMGTKCLEDGELLKLSMTVWDKLFRGSCIRKCGLRFPEGLRFEDNVFVLNFVSLYRNARAVPQRLYRYFRHEDSFTASSRQRREGVGFDYVNILEPMHEFWRRNNLLPQKYPLFERLCFDRLRWAIEICPPWERLGIGYAMGMSLRRWNMDVQNPVLRALREGNLSIRLGTFPGKEITLLKPLKGIQKIFYIGNCQGRRVFLLFGCKVASWKK